MVAPLPNVSIELKLETPSVTTWYLVRTITEILRSVAACFIIRSRTLPPLRSQLAVGPLEISVSLPDFFECFYVTWGRRCSSLIDLLFSYFIIIPSVKLCSGSFLLLCLPSASQLASWLRSADNMSSHISEYHCNCASYQVVTEGVANFNSM